MSVNRRGSTEVKVPHLACSQAWFDLLEHYQQWFPSTCMLRALLVQLNTFFTLTPKQCVEIWRSWRRMKILLIKVNIKQLTYLWSKNLIFEHWFAVNSTFFSPKIVSVRYCEWLPFWVSVKSKNWIMWGLMPFGCIYFWKLFSVSLSYRRFIYLLDPTVLSYKLIKTFLMIYQNNVIETIVSCNIWLNCTIIITSIGC